MKQEDTVRKCVASGKLLEKGQLLRFVAAPDLTIIPDFKKRLPGKGVYVTNSRQLLQKAIAGNLFAKALKLKVKPAPDLEDMVEKLLRHSALQAVSLARKAGCLVTGMDKVSDALKRNKVAFVLEALDGAEDGHEKIVRLAGEIPVYKLFTTEELDTALDKVNTVHAAFIKGEMAHMVGNEFQKLQSFLKL